MKNYSYTFTVEKPCNESWEKMLPSELGKFCLSCQHEVVDFSTFTDEEIVRYISTSTSNVCGRFKPAQLNRPMQLSQYVHRPHSFKYVVAGLMAVSLLPACNTEDTELSPIKLVEVPKLKVNKELAMFDDTLMLRGRVVDITYEQALTDARIFVNQTPLTTSVDQSGRFVIALPDSLLGKEVAFEIHAPGKEVYAGTVSAEEIWKNEEQVFRMYEKTVEPQPYTIMGDIQVLGNVSIQKEPLPIFIPYTPVQE